MGKISAMMRSVSILSFVLLLPAQSVDSFVPALARQRQCATRLEMVSLPAPIKNVFHKVKGWVSSNQEDLNEKAKQLVKDAGDAIVEFDDYLAEAIKKKGEEVTQDIAVKFVKMINGNWEVAIATDKSDTKDMMEGAMDELTEDVLSVLGEETSKDDVKAELKSNRLRIENTFDGSSYPLGVQINVYLSARKVIQAFGQLQFDLEARKLVFALDDLSVLNVKVDLTSVLEEAANDEEGEDEKDETDEDETTNGETDNEEKDEAVTEE